MMLSNSPGNLNDFAVILVQSGKFDRVARLSRPWITRKMRVPHSNSIPGSIRAAMTPTKQDAKIQKLCSIDST